MPLTALDPRPETNRPGTLSADRDRPVARPAGPAPTIPGDPPAGRRVLVVTPARDEAERLPATIASMVAQTVRPALWVIVDDGSADATARIALDAAAAHPWIRVVRRADRGSRALGSGVVQAFYDGLRAATELAEDLRADYVAKVDADITFGPRYLERALERFEEDPGLGIASGKVFRPETGGDVEEFMIDEHVTGAWKLYRRTCFEGIGGLVPAVMWDGIDFHRARQTGWRTRSFADADLRILHHRLMGSSDRNVYVGRIRWGRGQWYMGSNPLYVLGSALFRMRERPFVVGGLLLFWGYVSGWLKGLPRYDAPEFRREMRAWQRARLLRALTGKVR
jgi:glycosyltransferase involved in cell wall biosynthesis